MEAPQLRSRSPQLSRERLRLPRYQCSRSRPASGWVLPQVVAVSRVTWVLLLLAGCISCCGGLQDNVIGGEGSRGTPVGSYNIQVIENAVSVSHSSQLTLNVTPQM